MFGQGELPIPERPAPGLIPGKPVYPAVALPAVVLPAIKEEDRWLDIDVGMIRACARVTWEGARWLHLQDGRLFVLHDGPVGYQRVHEHVKYEPDPPCFGVRKWKAGPGRAEMPLAQFNALFDRWVEMHRPSSIDRHPSTEITPSTRLSRAEEHPNGRREIRVGSTWWWVKAQADPVAYARPTEPFAILADGTAVPDGYYGGLDASGGYPFPAVRFWAAWEQFEREEPIRRAHAEAVEADSARYLEAEKQFREEYRRVNPEPTWEDAVKVTSGDTL